MIHVVKIALTVPRYNAIFTRESKGKITQSKIALPVHKVSAVFPGKSKTQSKLALKVHRVQCYFSRKD